jgi:hypothetical protein
MLAAPPLTRPAATVRRSAVLAGLTASAVGLLVAGTLGTTGATIAGTAVHLLGASDEGALITGALTAAAALLPAGSLARRAWRIERYGDET